MACQLKLSTTFREDFLAGRGKEVTLNVEASGRASVQILHIRYAGGEIDAEPPFQFTVRTGLKKLIVLIESSRPGANVKLVEQCNGSKQVLNQFNFDPRNPARMYLVRGT